MKRQGDLFHYVVHINNLTIASHKAKRGKTSRNETRKYIRLESQHILDIQEMLVNKTYKTSTYKFSM